jgi:flavin-dependent dehydrogenase
VRGARTARVVVVGGGPAGAATAIALAGLDPPPVVLEAAPGPQGKVGESIPPTANPVLARLGLSAGLASSALPAYGTRSAWGAAEAVETDFVFGTAGCGWRVDRDRFEVQAASVAIAAGVDWRSGVRLVDCSPRGAGGWTLRVMSRAGPQSYQTDAVVDASGRAARFARLVGARRIRYDRLVAAVSYCSTQSSPHEADADSTTLVEAVPQGWWYSMFLPDHRLVTAFMTDADLLEETGARTANGLCRLLDGAPLTSSRVTAASSDWSSRGPQIRPAHTSRLTDVTGSNWLAVGDAAITYDPLTSYGIVAALGQGVHAAATMVQHLTGAADALPQHARLIDRAFSRYLALLHDRYGNENRWCDAPFWQPRHHPAFA